MRASGDFHLHSTASDGVHTPEWVIEEAAKNGVRMLSLTDHDTTAGLAEAQRTAQRLDLQLIPGVEVSSDYGKAEIHLLGYGFDTASPRLQEFFQWQREGRIGRVETMARILADLGMPISVERIFAIAGEATVGRPHVARALVEAGHCKSVNEAFDLWLGNGKPADVDRPKLPPEEAIRILHDEGAAVFIAHPIFMGENYDEIVEQLAVWGADGVETYYKNYDAATVARHEAIARRLGLACSGGSDYHGLGNPDDVAIGDIPFDDGHVQGFMEALEGLGVDTGKAAAH